MTCAHPGHALEGGACLQPWLVVTRSPRLIREGGQSPTLGAGSLTPHSFPVGPAAAQARAVSVLCTPQSGSITAAELAVPLAQGCGNQVRGQKPARPAQARSPG